MSCWERSPETRREEEGGNRPPGVMSRWDKTAWDKTACHPLSAPIHVTPFHVTSSISFDRNNSNRITGFFSSNVTSMSNQDVEAQKAADTSPAAAKTPSGAVLLVGKAAAISTLLVAVPALIVGSIALARANNAAATSQSQLNLDVSTAHHGGEGTTATKKSKKSGDDVESKGDTDTTTGTTLDAVSGAAIVKCGVIPVVGFADNSTGTWEGMDADLCRAVAAGVGAEVEFVKTTFPDRWVDLQSGRFDLLSAYTTHTMERDVSQGSVGKGFCFSEPYFYDGATCKLRNFESGVYFLRSREMAFNTNLTTSKYLLQSIS